MHLAQDEIVILMLIWFFLQVFFFGEQYFLWREKKDQKFYPRSDLAWYNMIWCYDFLAGTETNKNPLYPAERLDDCGTDFGPFCELGR